MAKLSKEETSRKNELTKLVLAKKATSEQETELDQLVQKEEAGSGKIYQSFIPAFIRAGKFDEKGFHPPTIKEFPFDVKHGHKSVSEHEKTVNYLTGVLPLIYKVFREEAPKKAGK